MVQVLGVALFAVVAAAGVRTEKAVKTDLQGTALKASLTEGFHFNKKAPNLVTVDGQNLRPKTIADRELEFADIPVTFKSGQVALYICDDAVTFCETQVLDLKGGPAKVKPQAATVSRKGRVNNHGFIEDDFAKAMQLAIAKKQNVLIDFSARWCPGCIRLESEMFPTKAFREMTRDLVKLKVDLDRFENGVLAEKYQIKGIPTLLVVNSAQKEIARIMDFQPVEVLGPFFAAIRSDPASLEDLMSRAQDGDRETRLRLGKRLWVAGRAQESYDVLKTLKPEPAELPEVAVAAAELAGPEKLESALRLALKDEPSSVRSIGWRSQLAEIVKTPAEENKLRDEGVKLADELLKSPDKLKAALRGEEAGEYTGYEGMLVALHRAGLIEASGTTPAQVEEAWRQSGKIGLSFQVPVQKQSLNIRLLTMLLAGRLLDDADRVSQALLKSDPSNPELQRRRLRVLVEMKRYDEAIKIGTKVVKNSYGRNEFWAAEVLARAYVESGRSKEAEKFINGYLGRNELDWANMKETRKSFEELRERLTKKQ